MGAAGGNSLAGRPSYLTTNTVFSYSTISPEGKHEETKKPSGEEEPEDLRMRTQEIGSTVDMGELLFPAFNTLVPSLCESLGTAVASSLPYREVESIVETLLCGVSFAFRTHLYEKRIVEVLRATFFTGHKEGTSRALLREVERVVSEEPSAGAFAPLRLECKLKSKTYQKKVRQVKVLKVRRWIRRKRKRK